MTIATNHLPTGELQALDAAHHMHPFTANNALGAKGARVIKSAEGVWLTDSDGMRIIDGMAGLWCVNIGYGRGELAETAARQMRELCYYNLFFQTTHPPAIALAAKLAELAPGPLNKIFFAGSGSEANDTNIRLVRQYWAMLGKPQKTKIIARRNAYHGSSLGSASLGGMQAMHDQGGMPIPDIHHIGQPNWWLEGGEMSPDAFGRMRARELEAAIEIHGPHRVAAFIAEPIQGAGGVIAPPESYWPEIQRICDAHEILLIADEVICGFGRTGHWFGSELYGIRPDIMTIAKGLSSGYAPIGGSIVTDAVADVVGRDEFFHGYTYSGHPVAAAVALENLRILEDEKIVEHARDVAGPYLQRKWAELAEHPLVGEAVMRGMIGSIALTPDKARRAPFAAEAGTAGFMVRERCFANNVIIRHVWDRMVVSPPLVITPEEIDELMRRLTRALDEAYVEIRDAGMLVAAA